MIFLFTILIFIMIFSAVYYVKLKTFFSLHGTDIIRKINILKENVESPLVNKITMSNNNTNNNNGNDDDTYAFYTESKTYFDTKIMSNNYITNVHDAIMLLNKIRFFGEFYI